MPLFYSIFNQIATYATGLLMMLLLVTHGNLSAMERNSERSSRLSERVSNASGSPVISKSGYKKIISLLALVNELKLSYEKTAEGRQLSAKIDTAVQAIPAEFLVGVSELKQVYADRQLIGRLSTASKVGYGLGTSINATASFMQSIGSVCNPILWASGAARLLGNKIKGSAQSEIEALQNEAIVLTSTQVSKQILQKLAADKDICLAFNNLMTNQLLATQQLELMSKNKENKAWQDANMAKLQQDILTNTASIKENYRRLMTTILHSSPVV